VVRSTPALFRHVSTSRAPPPAPAWPRRPRAGAPRHRPDRRRPGGGRGARMGGGWGTRGGRRWRCAAPNRGRRGATRPRLRPPGHASGGACGGATSPAGRAVPPRGAPPQPRGGGGGGDAGGGRARVPRGGDVSETRRWRVPAFALVVQRVC